MLDNQTLLDLVSQHGTPLFVVDHAELRANFRRFRERLPRVQCYFAIKANSDPAIVKTLFDEGASFDVASWNEFMTVYANIQDWPEAQRDHFVWDKIIFANTIKDRQTLARIRPYKPLMTYDNEAELHKIRAHCDTAGVVLRLRVPDVGSQVEMASKFGCEPGEALGLLRRAQELGLKVEGLSFHVGSQCTHFDNFTNALDICGSIYQEAKASGILIDFIDMGGGWPVPMGQDTPTFERLASIINAEIDRHFPPEVQIAAEPGRFMVATAGTLVSEIIGRARRDGKLFYHINDGVYHTFSGVVYDHWTPNFHALKPGPEEVCAVVGPTCDSFDKISTSELLPGNLEIGDLLVTDDIGAYSSASSTRFNGFDGAHILHINR
jgi:ornithine decarboxylase